MTQEHSPDEQIIRCEAITDEIVTSYAKQVFVLDFAEEVMRFDLSLPLPQANFSPSVSCFSWEPDRTHEFFAAYNASFRDRPGFPHWIEEQWVAWVSADPAFRPDLSRVAIAQGQPVGFITNEQESAQIGYIIQVGVHPDWRRQGLAAALMARSLQAWQAEGKEAVMLHVNVNNPGAIRLYQKLGFTIVARRGAFRKQRE
jgi:ribosomal protein S18 acetylase RimI-like enzyme